MKMWMNYLIIWALLPNLVPAFVNGSKCPPPEDIMPCRCRGRNNQIQVWCSHSDLDRVNGALENLMRLRSMPAIDELIVENNKMPALPARAFGALRIGRLLLRHNGLESVSRNAFAGLEDTIEELYIVEDKLTDFPYDAVEQLKNMEAFTIEKSKIRLLPKFNGLNRLKHIRIDGSLISSLPVGAFAQMASIKQIHLVNSNLVALAEGIFGPLDTLLLANFSGNSINIVQRKSFALLPKLEVLSLSNNRLEDSVKVGRACEELYSMKSLDLSNNLFKVIPEGSFVNLRTLQMLNLGYNQIQTVNPRSFTHLPALRKVDLSGNLLRNVQQMFIDSSPLLEELRIRKNLISSPTEIGEILNSLKSLRYLDVGENGITALPTNGIVDHTQIQKIDMSDNQITKIQKDAFRNVPSLTELSFRNNSLAELPSETNALDIPSLKILDLSSNSISAISGNNLKRLSGLVQLDLNFNKIKSIGSATFSENILLLELDLTGNGIQQISADSMQKLDNLKKLDLSRNHLENLQSGTFHALKSLKSLNLANNKLATTPGDLFSNLNQLEELSMKSNMLTNLPSNIFTPLENLRELNLKYNSISSINYGLFNGLKNLRTLKLASNQISNIHETSFKNLNKIKSLDLSSNRLTKLESNVFKGLTTLEKFEARENRISLIEDSVFSDSDKLATLDLAHNALESIPTFVKSGSSLKVIDLSHNLITNLGENTFKKLVHLMELYVNDNKIQEIKSGTLNNLESLTIVDMDGNELDNLPSETFKNLPKLIYLRISRNKLRTISNNAFSEMGSLDGLDLQQNELESIGDGAFDRTGSLKYLNLSHNNFDSVSRAGLFPLHSLEVLDLSFNRLRELDDKSLRHLQWLVELRVNDNGICRLPVGIFDKMSRLKMLVLRNNFITHLYEAVFYRLKNNIAFLDISGNPISCDCELTWLRQLITRDSIKELSESTCDSPNDLQGLSVRSLRPSRMVCTTNSRFRGIPPAKYNEADCPLLSTSKRKPRPVISEVIEKPLFGTGPSGSATGEYFEVEDPDYPETTSNDIKNLVRKGEKFVESNDYLPGDSPTIYASSSVDNNKKVQNDAKSTSGLSALSNLLGIPLDFGLNLGISPSVSISNKNSDGHGVEDTRGFAPGIKGPDPLPPSWLNRPSKLDNVKTTSIYEPPEYIPRKPLQPYIPLNPYAESITKSSIVPPSRNVNERNNKFESEFSPPFHFPSTPNTQWSHGTYPEAETGFIPIEPFFHSAIAKNSRRNKTSGPEEIPRASVSSYNPPSPNFYDAEATLSTTFRNELSTPTESPMPINEGEQEYEDDSTYTPVETQDQSNNDSEEETQVEGNNDSLSDFWGMFTGNKSSTQDEKHPLNFSAPIDTHSVELFGTPPTTELPPRPTSFPSSYVSDDISSSSNQIQYDANLQQQQKGRKTVGKSTITKVKLDETSLTPTQTPNNNIRNNYNGNTFSIPTNNRDTKPTSSNPAIPPVLIGDLEEPLDWYYRNYNIEQNPEEEIEKYLERNRATKIDDVLVAIGNPSTGTRTRGISYTNNQVLSFIVSIILPLLSIQFYRN